MIAPVILAGGSGKRLWPLSRTLYPKQFLNLVHDETTLFQDTLFRLPVEADIPTIICNEDHRFLAAEQIREIGIKESNIILEKNGRNTAPAIAIAALSLLQKMEDPILLVLSADHLIEDNEAFQKAIKIGGNLAKQNKFVTFGVKPSSPESGYGYIEINKSSSSDYFDIKSFKEKPSSKNAEKYFSSDNYLWNCGIFMFKASLYIKELEKFEPQIMNICKKTSETFHKDLDFTRFDNNEFSNCPDKSIDYAVMEKTLEGVVVPLKTYWSDVGSWLTLSALKPKDEKNNNISGDIFLDDVSNTSIHGNNRLITAIGVSDLVIVDTQDALLVLNKKYSQNISNIIETLHKNHRTESESHRKVYRPWGYYDSIDYGQNFKVKRILVNPHSKISLQTHQFRAEHWVVVKGIAKITCGNKVFQLKENQSTYIPKGQIHRIENNDEVALEIIEIQTGKYLGEDDIIRLEDDYHRTVLE
jgi:mannose-1-phosphate guanylyltransferase